jgi:hypothetical protein
MLIFKYLLISTIFLLNIASAENPGDEERIFFYKSSIDPNGYRMRIYLNSENPYTTEVPLYKSTNQVPFTLPIPDRFKVTAMRGHIQYKTGMSVNKYTSYLLATLNDTIFYQEKLVGKAGAGNIETRDFDVPAHQLYDGYNALSFQLIQFAQDVPRLVPPPPVVESINLQFIPKEPAVEKCVPLTGGGSGSPAANIWTQLHTRFSYIEFDFLLKPFEEQVSSIYKYILDNKYPIKPKVNFVFPEIPTEQDFYNYGFMANLVGYLMKFKDIDISVSTEIDSSLNNIIVMPRDRVKAIFTKLFDEDNSSRELKDILSNKLKGNINLIANPFNLANGILAITGDNQKEIENGMLRLLDDDIAVIEEQNINVKNIVMPEESAPFTAPSFVTFEKRVHFNDPTLIEVSECSDSYLATFESRFKIYPVVKFNTMETEHIELFVKYFTANSDAMKLAFNVYINGTFSHQFFQTRQADASSKIVTEKTYFSPALLQQGANEFSVEAVKYQVATDQNFGLRVIRTTILNDSYFIVPKGEGFVEYPYLKYISQMTFPYSIYPDLQNTGILITDFNADTIASALQMSFQLGKNMQYPGYYMTFTYDINKLLDKDIIVLGTQIEKYAPLYENAPIKFTENGYIKEEYQEEFNRTLITHEITDLADTIVAQTYQSTFNPKRTVFELSAKNPATLLKGIQESGLPASFGDGDHDVWFYNIETEKSIPMTLGKKYTLTQIVDEVKMVEKKQVGSYHTIEVEEF